MSLEEDQANQETRCHLYLAEPQIRSAEGRSDNKSTFKVIFSKNTIDQNVSCLKMDFHNRWIFRSTTKMGSFPVAKGVTNGFPQPHHIENENASKLKGWQHCWQGRFTISKKSGDFHWFSFFCALRALGLLLADGTPTVGGGKTFWAVSQFFLRKQL